MRTATLTDKGQVTIPAEIRRELGIHGGTKVTFGVQDGVVLIRPLRSLRELRGAAAAYAKGTYIPFEEAREIALTQLAEEVAREGRK